MSVSLVDLRLEIGVDYPLLPHLHFTASKLKRSMPLTDNCQGTKTNEIPENVSTEREEEKSRDNGDDWKTRYRGSRELHTITIETLTDIDKAGETLHVESLNDYHQAAAQATDQSTETVTSTGDGDQANVNVTDNLSRTESEDNMSVTIHNTQVENKTLAEKSIQSENIGKVRKQPSVTTSKRKKASSSKAVQAAVANSNATAEMLPPTESTKQSDNKAKTHVEKDASEHQLCRANSCGTVKESRTVSTQKDYSPVLRRAQINDHTESLPVNNEMDISNNKENAALDCKNDTGYCKEASPLSSDGDVSSQKESSPVSGESDRAMHKETSPALSESSISSTERRTRNLLSSQIPFYSGNHFVEVTKGILHLYKENQRTPLAEEAERSEMLCILAVPASMTSHDLLQFTAPVNSDVEHMRIIHETKPNQYMVLIKFRNQQSADEFYRHFNGVKFNSIEPEICHLVFVAKVETIKESEEACLPLPGHTELPTCPVCLERMDESVEGILTILCNHSFHGSCLAKWGDTSCPVCRYCQTPEPVPDNSCFGCGSQENLWICLICGHVGCGRYVEGHAYKHYLETQHTYAMQLGNNRVWDYAGDNYVHRLIQNKADGKPVELEPRWIEQEEKLDSIQLEYTYLLTSQLEAQRHFFENRIARMEQEAHRQLEELKEKTKQAVEERKQLEEKLRRVSREKQTQEKKVNQLTSKVNKTMLELKDEKEMNKCLRQNQQAWQQKLRETEKQLKELKEAKDQEIQELRDQVRDLMFYLEAQEKLQKVPDVTAQELQEGQIVVGASGPATGETPRHRRKKPR